MSHFDYKYRPQPSITDIFEEIFAPFTAAAAWGDLIKTHMGRVSTDGSVYTVAVEIPRLVRDTISVEIEPTSTQYKTMAHKVVVKAGQDLLTNYLDSSTESAKKRYEQEITILGQRVALDGSLTLSYTEGVLTIDIPLCKPVQPKKQTLSARLSDMI